MRQRHLHQLKIIDYLIRYRSLPMTDELGDSLFKQFHIYNDGKGGYDVSKSVFSGRTLRRLVEDLYQKGIVLKRKNRYSINYKLFIKNNVIPEQALETILYVLMENREFKAYDQLKNLSENQDFLFSSQQMNRYKETVREKKREYMASEELIWTINNAMEAKKSIFVRYKGRQYHIFPLCISLSRDGTRTYLYYERRHRIGPPFDFSLLEFIKEGSTQDIDRKEYDDIIRRAWDIDIHDPIHVKIKVLKESPLKAETLDMLKENFQKTGENKKEVFYEGMIVGINDFKTWVRSNPKECVLIEPQSIADEIRASVKSRLERYGEIIE